MFEWLIPKSNKMGISPNVIDMTKKGEQNVNFAYYIAQIHAQKQN